MIIKGGTHYLLLVRQASGEYCVICHERFDRALAAWDARGTRISPIFSLNDAPAPAFPAGVPTWLLFCGPVHPGELEALRAPETYLTLGLYNVLVICRDQDSRLATKKFAADHGLAWEEWGLNGNLVDAALVTHSPLDARTGSPKLTTQILQPLYPKDHPLCAAGREYTALLAESISRAGRYTPATANELLTFDSLLREHFLLPDGPVPVKHGLLTTANAALSRYTAETYAGTSPVLSNECHYCTHSLLGIGTASLALVQIRRFVERVIEETRLIERVKRLKGAQGSGKLLQAMDPLDSFWNTDFLPPPSDPPPSDPAIPLLTYYSGRDGFRATHLALSAPLELLESSNSTTWTLLTLTHEISHIIVDGVLGALLPKVQDHGALQHAVSTLRKGNNAQTIFEQLQQLVLYTLWQTHHPLATRTVGPHELAEILKAEGQNANELITHAFDFLCFYGGKPESYIPSIWASWSVIPNIEHRISDYIMRSLCALLTLNLRRENGVEITIDQLIHLLEDTRHRFPGALYIPDAIDDLTSRRLNYSTALDKRRPFALFVRHFMFSPDVAKRLTGQAGSPIFTPLEFGTERVANPLAFIRDHSQDQTSNHLRSAWLLQQLAFGGDL